MSTTDVIKSGFDQDLLQKALHHKGALVITVHGTFAGADSSHGEKWWQKESSFHKKLQDRVWHKRLPFFLPFHWSGANKEQERKKSSKQFKKDIKQLLNHHSSVNIIAHSHGGNVVVDGVRTLPEQLRQRIRVISFGTPFIFPRYRMGRKFLSFGTLVLATIILLVGIGSLAFGPYVRGIFAGVGLAILGAFLHDVLRQYFRRRQERKNIDGWVVVYHSADEAIAALEHPDRKNLTVLSERDVKRLIWLSFAAGVLISVTTIALMWLGEFQTWGPIILTLSFSLSIACATAIVFGHRAASIIAKSFNGFFQRMVWKQSFGLSFFDNTPQCSRLPIMASDVVRDVEFTGDDFGASNHQDRAFELHRVFMKIIRDGAPEAESDVFRRLSNDLLIHNNYFAAEEAMDEVVRVIEKGV